MESTMYYTDSGVLVIGRIGSYSSPPALVANIVLRLILSPIAILLTWVPLRLLWRNGEFPACTFVICIWVMIFFVFINAAIWHNQDFDRWWLGFGWCDVQAYTQYALTTTYSASVCAIMQRLSSQVGLTRVSGLSSREKRRRLILQSAIIFPVPLLQIMTTIFVQGQRYGLAPGSGCANEYYPTPVFLVFFVFPPVLFTFIACFHTFQVYKKFREVDVDSRAALAGTNTTAYLRRQRARRKLYFMVLCILIPYTPIIVAFCAINIVEGWPWTYPSDFQYIHYKGTIPWNSISILSYDDIGFLALNSSWIPVVSAFIAFIFFGTSKEAINIYRSYLLALGLGRLFPGLHELYDPDRDRSTAGQDSTASTAATQLSTMTSSVYQSRKGSLTPVYVSSTAGMSERAGSQSTFLATIASRDGDGIARPPRPVWRRWYGKVRSLSVASRRSGDTEEQELELELGQQPVEAASPLSRGWLAAPAAATRTPFNTGLNWFTPSTIFSTLPSLSSSPSAPAWKPVVFGPSAENQRAGPGSAAAPASPASPESTTLAGAALSTGALGHDTRLCTFAHVPDFASPPQPPSPMSLAISQMTGPADTTSTWPLATTAAAPTNTPFDGSTAFGSQAVRTHVWSDSEGPETATSAEPKNDGSDGAGSLDSDNSARGQHQHGVRVQRCIVSEITR